MASEACSKQRGAKMIEDQMAAGNCGGGVTTYHDLSVPIRESSCCVTADRVLAVSEPTSEGILHL